MTLRTYVRCEEVHLEREVLLLNITKITIIKKKLVRNG